MSYSAMGRVRGCALTDGTLVDVLEALAYSLNERTMKCCPSTETIVRLARVSKKYVRRALRTLEEQGFISSVQKAGGVRHFTLHLDRLPVVEEEGATNVTHATKVTPVTNITPLTNVTGRGRQMSRGGGDKCHGEGVTNVSPNKEENKEGNKEENREVVLRATFAADAAPGPQAAPARTSTPDGFEESLYAEADLFAAQQEENTELPECAFLQSDESQATYPSPEPAKAKKGPSACAETASEKPKTKFPVCPYEQIVELYHETCPMLPRVMVISSARKRSMKTRWTELCAEDDYRTQAEGLDAMKTFFQIVAQSRFLTGRCDPGYGRTRIFRADLDWLMKPSNFIKVCEGKYSNANA